MATPVIRSVETTYPVSVDRAWAILSDTPRMVDMDPLLVSYEPENERLEEGTLNRVRSRVGPFPATLITRTEILDPPHRAVFVSVRPSRPVHVRTEDSLEEADGGCRYRVVFTVTPTVPGLGPLAARYVAGRLARTREQLMARLRDVMTADG
jgi:hypothetical protein